MNDSKTFNQNLMVLAFEYVRPCACKCYYFYQKEMGKHKIINLKWIDITVFCIVSMSAVLMVSLCPADKESFSDLLQI